MDFLIAVAVGGLACVIVVVLIIAGHAKNDRSFPRDDIECVETADDSAMPTVSFRANLLHTEFRKIRVLSTSGKGHFTKAGIAGHFRSTTSGKRVPKMKQSSEA